MAGMDYEYILERLMQGGTVSGEELSRKMGLSRAAVWKGVLRLRENGWHIEAAPHIGYWLVPAEDSLLPMDIYQHTKTERYGRSARYYKEADSTNLRAREWAQNGAPDGALVVADKQTAGRGRLARRWESPDGAGIYMSLIMKPELPMQRLARLMPAIPLGLCRGLREFCGDAVSIKWPNDIVCAGRKICGILLEAQSGMDGVDWLIAGIGINVHQKIEDFSETVRQTASSIDALTGKRCNRARVVGAVMREIERCADMFRSGREAELMREYEALSATLGRRVRVISASAAQEADAIGLKPDGALIVRLDDGTEKAVYAGDVSVRGIMGYI